MHSCLHGVFTLDLNVCMAHIEFLLDVRLGFCMVQSTHVLMPLVNMENFTIATCTVKPVSMQSFRLGHVAMSTVDNCCDPLIIARVQ